jgi:hypothetical protein
VKADLSGWWRRLRPLQQWWVVGGIVILAVTAYNARMVQRTIQLGQPSEVVRAAPVPPSPGVEQGLGGAPTASTRDPFSPASEAIKSDSPIVKLKGVVWDSRRPLAVVEDGAGVTYIIKSGDRVGEDQLRAIKPDRIVLRKKSGKTYELSLTKP